MPGIEFGIEQETSRFSFLSSDGDDDAYFEGMRSLPSIPTGSNGVRHTQPALCSWAATSGWLEGVIPADPIMDLKRDTISRLIAHPAKEAKVATCM